MDLDAVRYHFTGPIASVILPFNRDGSVDHDGLRKFIDVSIEGGSRSIILTSGDTHYHCLSDDEIAEVTRTTCEHAAGRAMVVSADCGYATGRAIEFAKFARDLGAGINMCLPPNWAQSCTPETLAEHYSAVAQVMPVMVVTAIFGGGLPPSFGLQTLEKTLEKSDNVLAIKDDVGGVFVQRMCMLCHDRCAIFAGGQKQGHMAMLPFGVDGYMSMMVTFKPDLARRYWESVEAGDLEVACGVIDHYDAPLFDHLMGLHGGWNAGAHAMLELYGISGRWRRKPYVSMNDQEMETFAAFLRSKGLLSASS